MIFTVSPFSSACAYVEGCLAKGVTSTGSDATTRRGCGDCGYSEAAGIISTHSAYAEYSKESYFAGFSINTDNTAQGVFAGTGIGKRGNSLEITLTMADVSRLSDFLVSAKYQFLSETSSHPAMAVGIDAINEIPQQMPLSPYIVASKCFSKSTLPLLASLGWGSGRFANSFFGSLAVGLHRRCNFIVEYDGLGVNVGISFATEVPLVKSLPVVVALGMHNVLASKGKSTIGIGAGMRFH